MKAKTADAAEMAANIFSVANNNSHTEDEPSKTAAFLLAVKADKKLRLNQRNGTLGRPQRNRLERIAQGKKTYYYR